MDHRDLVGLWNLRLGTEAYVAAKHALVLVGHRNPECWVYM